MKKNKIMVAIIIILILIVVLALAMLLFLKKNDDSDENLTNTNSNANTNTEEINNNVPNSNGISIVNNESEFTSDLDKKNNNSEKEYIELTEENYNKYDANTADQMFIIQDAIKNGNGTTTIKGRVYKFIEIPNTITQEQYQTLLNGGTLNILGEKVVKNSNDEEAKEAGYDIELTIESKKYDIPMIYYVKRNDDGSGALYEGSEAKLAEGTDIYMQITLSDDTYCLYHDKDMTLGDRYKENYHIDDVDKTRLTLEKDEFMFDAGECSAILYANDEL